MKLQTWKKTVPPPGFNIALDRDPSITSGCTQEVAEYEDASILGRASLALEPTGDNISLLGNDASIIGGDLYPPGDTSLVISTSTCHTSASKVKEDTSLITQ